MVMILYGHQHRKSGLGVVGRRRALLSPAKIICVSRQISSCLPPKTLALTTTHHSPLSRHLRTLHVLSASTYGSTYGTIPTAPPAPPPTTPTSYLLPFDRNGQFIFPQVWSIRHSQRSVGQRPDADTLRPPFRWAGCDIYNGNVHPIQRC